MTLECVIHECLQRHFQGVEFRERNAGHGIDSEMNNQGFNNRIGVDLDTGGCWRARTTRAMHVLEF